VFIKALNLRSLLYVATVTGSIVAAAGVALGLSSDAGDKTEIFSTQVNRSLKSNKLPIKQTSPHANVKEFVKVPAKVAPKFEVNCRPVDVPGRCFADAKPNRRIT
jgi:hypothetical protein